MATAKKKTATKPAAKKAAPKTTAPKATAKPKAAPKPKKEVVVYTADQVELTKTQQNQLNIVLKNEIKIHDQQKSMIDVAIDSGQRLTMLRDGIQKKFGRVWKEWATANLSIGYPQVSRYMKAYAGAALLEGKEYSTLEEAVKLISYKGDDEALAADVAKKEAKKASAPSSGNGKAPAFSTMALMEAIDSIADVPTLIELRDYIQERIDQAGSVVATVEADEADEDQEDMEVDEEANDALSELAGLSA